MPNRQKGICQPFKTCAVLFDIYQRKDMSNDDVELIKNSFCPGSDNGKAYVCCPIPPKVTTTTPEPVTESPGQHNCPRACSPNSTFVNNF